MAESVSEKAPLQISAAVLRGLRESAAIGLVVLALSRYFAYGMQLQNDVDGLL